MTEKELHRQICTYLKYQYPNVIFSSDLSGAGRLTMGQAVALKSLRSGRAFPDLQIMEPRNGYHGLFIEIKPEDVKLLKAHPVDSEGNVNYATPHIREQAEMLEKLSERGYMAVFGIGFDDIIKILDNYLKK